MFDNPLLNICIGLVFFYLLLSIIVTTLQEVIAGFFDFRGRNLMKAIDELIAPGDIKEKFFRHPLIFPLFRGDLKQRDGNWHPVKPPAYIPTRNFAVALTNVIRESGDSPAGDTGAGVRLAAQLTAAQPAAPAFPAADDPVVKELERLYDSAIERAAGWYKRWAMYISLGLGLLLATILNADSIHIARQLWDNPTLSKAVVQAAENFSNAKSDRIKASCTPGRGEIERVSPRQDETVATAGNASMTTLAEKACSATLADFRQRLDEFTAVGFPLGWAMQTPEKEARAWDRFWTAIKSIDVQPGQSWASAIPGILLTTIAIGLGSNFWFDVLGRFMNFRSAGKREETMDERDKAKDR